MVRDERLEQLLPTSIKIPQYFGYQLVSMGIAQPLDLDMPMKETQGLAFQEFTAQWESKGPVRRVNSTYHPMRQCYKRNASKVCWESSERSSELFRGKGGRVV